MKRSSRRPDLRISVKPSDAESIVAGTEEQAETEQAAESPSRVHRFHAKHYALARLVAEYGTDNIREHLKTAGFAASARPRDVLAMIAELVEEAKAQRVEGKSMTVEEALQIAGDLARATSDDRVKLAAARTVLEVHEVIGRKSSDDRSHRNDTTRKIEQLIAELRKQPSMKRAIRNLDSAHD